MYKKRKNFLIAMSSNCSISAKFCPMLVQMPYSGGINNPKIMNYAPNFLLLSSLAYKLVNLLVLKIFYVK